jgi:hypothetical protein
MVTSNKKPVGKHLTVETREEEQIINAGAKVLRAGAWLIRNGYARMMLLPYSSPSGAAWRCEFHPLNRLSRTVYRYTTGSGTKYLANHCGGYIHKNVSPRRLAEAIMKSVPDDIKAACTGHATSETLRWLEGLERQLDVGSLPEAFNAYSNDYSRWRLVNLTGRNGDAFIEPQPGYIPPGQEPRIVDDQEWRHGVAAWNAVEGHATVTLPLAELAHDRSVL